MYEEIFESIRVAAAKRNLKESTAGAYCRTVKYFVDTIGKVSLAELIMEDLTSLALNNEAYRTDTITIGGERVYCAIFWKGRFISNFS